MNRIRQRRLKDLCPLCWRDTLYTIVILLCTSVLCLCMSNLDPGGNTYVSMLFLLAVVLISRFTNGYFYGIIGSFLGMFCVNYMFTYPFFAFNFTISGYPITFISMLVVSLITCTLTTQIKEQEKFRAAAELEKMRSNLLRAVSHDLRTPLTSILGASSAILENDDVIDKQRRIELLSGIREEAEWLIRMVENLLSVTRFQSGVTNLYKQPEAAEEIMGEAVQKFHKRFPALPVSVQVPEEMLEVPMDPILIEQVIVNLLENAAKHSGGASHAELSVKKVGEQAVFEVWNDGNSIPPSEIPHLFTGYYLHRAEQGGADTGRNMGIGLAVCMSIIQAHGGNMKVENSPRGGVMFQFHLPLGEE